MDTQTIRTRENQLRAGVRPTPYSRRMALNDEGGWLRYWDPDARNPREQGRDSIIDDGGLRIDDNDLAPRGMIRFDSYQTHGENETMLEMSVMLRNVLRLEPGRTPEDIRIPRDVSKAMVRHLLDDPFDDSYDLLLYAMRALDESYEESKGFYTFDQLGVVVFGGYVVESDEPRLLRAFGYVTGYDGIVTTDGEHESVYVFNGEDARLPTKPSAEYRNIDYPETLDEWRERHTATPSKDDDPETDHGPSDAQPDGLPAPDPATAPTGPDDGTTGPSMN